MSIGGEWWAARRTRAFGIILMLHRVGKGRDPGYEGHSPDSLRKAFSYLRRSSRYHPVELERFFSPVKPEVPRHKKPVAIAFDDGYHDQLEVAGPILAEFDIPATVFITSGFVDGELWMWWDQIRYALRETTRSSLSLEGPGTRKLTWDSAPESREGAADRLVKTLKSLPDPVRKKALAELPEALDVEIPSAPPECFAPTSWGVMRQWEALGLMRFAPHTRSHPILSRVDAQSARYEIEESWRRLKEEMSTPLPVLAFPNGRSEDFGVRELRLVEEAGLLGSLSAVPGLVSWRDGRPRGQALPRYAFEEELSRLRMILSGFEAVRRGRI